MLRETLVAPENFEGRMLRNTPSPVSVGTLTPQNGFGTPRPRKTKNFDHPPHVKGQKCLQWPCSPQLSPYYWAAMTPGAVEFLGGDQGPFFHRVLPPLDASSHALPAFGLPPGHPRPEMVQDIHNQSDQTLAQLEQARFKRVSVTDILG